LPLAGLSPGYFPFCFELIFFILPIKKKFTGGWDKIEFLGERNLPSQGVDRKIFREDPIKRFRPRNSINEPPSFYQWRVRERTSMHPGFTSSNVASRAP